MTSLKAEQIKIKKLIKIDYPELRGRIILDPLPASTRQEYPDKDYHSRTETITPHVYHWDASCRNLHLSRKSLPSFLLYRISSYPLQFPRFLALPTYF
ncbi:hypothetical protein PGT21_006500 [Puccinia graminis f. sp. tritici]|uniref:Uncharacterized protein n=1 Tax=Puccinia graminis f. sp. tritici TaxID=56615 RepID=A0A5B0QMC2_PUCGR|nr:hypothetical protein PGT21_006500 [Puccinia graminis f. sp. tritici]